MEGITQMFDLATDFSKLTFPEKLIHIDSDLSEDDARKQVETFIKSRIRTNLYVATWSTKYNYIEKNARYMWEYDLYITYDIIKFILNIINNIDVRLWNTVIYNSYYYDEKGENIELERGFQCLGEFIISFKNNNNAIKQKGKYKISDLTIFVYSNQKLMISFSYSDDSNSSNLISICEHTLTCHKAYKILKEISNDRFNL